MTSYLEDKPYTLQPQHFEKILPGKSNPYFDILVAEFAKSNINTLYRTAMFLAQTMVESNYYNELEGNFNYSAQGLLRTFPSYFTPSEAVDYARKPEAIANHAYANRYGNGPESSGDGWRYRDRGLIQLTFKSNYLDCHYKTGIDCVNNPDLLTQPLYAVKSALYFWTAHGLNRYSDKCDVRGCTKIINPSLLKLSERQSNFDKILCILNDGVNCGQPTVPSTKTSDSRKPTPDSPITVIEEPAIETMKDISSTSRSKYPWNLVYETRSGHVIELDDEPGHERINIFHRSGSYITFTPDGDIVTKATRNKMDFTTGATYSIHQGDSITKNIGNVRQEVVGDIILKSSNDIFLEADDRVQFNTPLVSASNIIVSPNAEILNLLTSEKAIINDEFVVSGSADIHTLSTNMSTSTISIIKTLIVENIVFGSGVTFSNELMSILSEGL